MTEICYCRPFKSTGHNVKWDHFEILARGRSYAYSTFNFCCRSTVYFFWRCMLEHTKRQVKVSFFFFPEVRLYFLMFISTVRTWSLTRAHSRKWPTLITNSFIYGFPRCRRLIRELWLYQQIKSKNIYIYIYIYIFRIFFLLSSRGSVRCCFAWRVNCRTLNCQLFFTPSSGDFLNLRWSTFFLQSNANNSDLLMKLRFKRANQNKLESGSLCQQSAPERGLPMTSRLLFLVITSCDKNMHWMDAREKTFTKFYYFWMANLHLFCH